MITTSAFAQFAICSLSFLAISHAVVLDTTSVDTWQWLRPGAVSNEESIITFTGIEGHQLLGDYSLGSSPGLAWEAVISASGPKLAGCGIGVQWSGSIFLTYPYPADGILASVYANTRRSSDSTSIVSESYVSGSEVLARNDMAVATEFVGWQDQTETWTVTYAYADDTMTVTVEIDGMESSLSFSLIPLMERQDLTVILTSDTTQTIQLSQLDLVTNSRVTCPPATTLSTPSCATCISVAPVSTDAQCVWTVLPYTSERFVIVNEGTEDEATVLTHDPLQFQLIIQVPLNAALIGEDEECIGSSLRVEKAIIIDSVASESVLGVWCLADNEATVVGALQLRYIEEASTLTVTVSTGANAPGTAFVVSYSAEPSDIFTVGGDVLIPTPSSVVSLTEKYNDTASLSQVSTDLVAPHDDLVCLLVNAGNATGAVADVPKVVLGETNQFDSGLVLFDGDGRVICNVKDQTALTTSSYDLYVVSGYKTAGFHAEVDVMELMWYYTGLRIEYEGCEDGYEDIYTDSNGECRMCGMGSSSSNGSPCEACHPGTYSGLSGSSQCVPCPLGTFSEMGGASSCTACLSLGLSFYSSKEGASACSVCGDRDPSQALAQVPLTVDGLPECTCTSGYYPNPRSTNSTLICLPCPIEEDGRVMATCPGGVLHPVPAPGFWAKDGETDPSKFLTCASAAACVGGTTGDAGCADEFMGYMCSTCSPGHYRFLSDCRPCPSSEQSDAIIFLIVMSLFLVFALIIVWSRNRGGGPSLGSLSISFSFLQVFAAFVNVDLRWPSFTLDVFQVLSVVNFNIEFTQPECHFLGSSYRERWNAQMLFPLAGLGYILVLWFLYSIYALVRRDRDIAQLAEAHDEDDSDKPENVKNRRASISHHYLDYDNEYERTETSGAHSSLLDSGASSEEWSSGAEDKPSSPSSRRVSVIEEDNLFSRIARVTIFGNAVRKTTSWRLRLLHSLRANSGPFINGFVMFLDLSYIILAKVVLEVFDCTNRRDGQRTMDSSPEIVCDASLNSEYETLRNGAIVGVFVYIIGIPVALGSLLYLHRHQLGIPRVARRICSLYGKYERRWYLWEVVVILRKFFVIAAIILFSALPAMQLAFLMFVILVSLSLHVFARPYRYERHDVLDFTLLVLNFLVLLSGMMFLVDRWPVDDGGQTRDAFAYVVLVLLIVGAIAIIACEVVEALEFRRVRQARRMHQSSTIGKGRLFEHFVLWNAHSGCSLYKYLRKSFGQDTTGKILHLLSLPSKADTELREIQDTVMVAVAVLARYDCSLEISNNLRTVLLSVFDTSAAVSASVIKREDPSLRLPIGLATQVRDAHLVATERGSAHSIHSINESTGAHIPNAFRLLANLHDAVDQGRDLCKPNEFLQKFQRTSRAAAMFASTTKVNREDSWDDGWSFSDDEDASFVSDNSDPGRK